MTVISSVVAECTAHAGDVGLVMLAVILCVTAYDAVASWQAWVSLLQAWTDEWCFAGVSRLNHRHHVRPHCTLYLFCVCSLFLKKIFAHCVKLFGSQAARMSGNICVCICIHLMFALKRISVRDLFPHRSRIKIHLSANGTQNWEFTSILVRCCLDDRRASGL